MMANWQLFSILVTDKLAGVPGCSPQTGLWPVHDPSTWVAHRCLWHSTPSSPTPALANCPPPLLTYLQQNSAATFSLILLPNHWWYHSRHSLSRTFKVGEFGGEMDGNRDDSYILSRIKFKDRWKFWKNDIKKEGEKTSENREDKVWSCYVHIHWVTCYVHIHFGWHELKKNEHSRIPIPDIQIFVFSILKCNIHIIHYMPLYVYMCICVCTREQILALSHSLPITRCLCAEAGRRK